MISAIKRKLFPACSDSNCFNARVNTKSLRAAEKLSPLFGEEGRWEEEFLWKKEPSFVVLHSVFFCQIRQKARRAYRPAAVSPSAALGPPKARININPADDSTKVKILQLDF